jgi:hypothetical protein
VPGGLTGDRVDLRSPPEGDGASFCRLLGLIVAG